MAHITQTGTLTVYRDSSLDSFLSARVDHENGQMTFFYPAPKCFDDLITDGKLNKVKVEYRVSEDGKRPRKVVKIGECF